MLHPVIEAAFPHLVILGAILASVGFAEFMKWW